VRYLQFSGRPKTGTPTYDTGTSIATLKITSMPPIWNKFVENCTARVVFPLSRETRERDERERERNKRGGVTRGGETREKEIRERACERE
jgi:hypothetical protein